MRHLQRGPAPSCLASFAHGRQRWSDLQGAAKEEIWGCLNHMQRERCAYCEGPLEEHRRHIDHFFPKSRQPQGTFAWPNLLGSCNRADSCGHHKDSRSAPTYQQGDLIDPAGEDPDDFFIILPSGRIDVRRDRPERDQQRAELTLKVLNLNDDYRGGGRSLVAERARVLQFYRGSDPDLVQELETWSAEDRSAYVRGELAQASDTAYGSIVRHFLRPLA